MVHLDGNDTRSEHLLPELLNILLTKMESSAQLEQVKCFRL